MGNGGWVCTTISTLTTTTTATTMMINDNGHSLPSED